MVPLLTPKQAADIMCAYCRNEGHLIPDSRFGMRHELGEVEPTPERIERQYIPNNGEYEGWIHRDIYGYVHQCEAGPLHEYERNHQ